MATLVKKFGGSSVATPEKMHGIVDRILRERQPDDRIVLVVSAMGDHTDDLLTLAAKVNPEMRTGYAACDRRAGLHCPDGQCFLC